MSALALLLSLLLVAASQDASPVYPQAEITSPRLQVTVHLPDPHSGYYRGTRFDWSGAIASLRWQGHEYFGPWFERHDPLLHDGITGPVEEFQAGESSVGYAEAPVGGTFVRIGVGHVRKPEEPAYRRFATYEIVNGGRWMIERGPGQHDVRARTATRPTATRTCTARRCASRATRWCSTTRSATPASKRIETSVYNHNFFTLDRRPTGPQVSVTFPFDAKATRADRSPGHARGARSAVCTRTRRR